MHRLMNLMIHMLKIYHLQVLIVFDVCQTIEKKRSKGLKKTIDYYRLK